MGVILEPFFFVLALIVDIYFKIVVVEIVLHWLIHFKIIQAENKYAKKLVEILQTVTEPVYAKIRSKIPPLAGFDLSPFILLLVLLFLNRLLYNISNYALQ